MKSGVTQDRAEAELTPLVNDSSIVPAASVVARMDEALATFAGDPPRNISFLSGPSRTGDIEQTLTVGAHGPKKAIALLLPP